MLVASECFLCLALELPDALARDLELGRELSECGRIMVIETIAPDQDVACPLGQALYGLLKLRCLHLRDQGVGRVGGLLVLYEVPELGGGVLRGRLVEACGVRRYARRKVGLPFSSSQSCALARV